MIHKFVLLALVLVSPIAKSEITIKIITKSYKQDELRVFFKETEEESYSGKNSKTLEFSGNNKIDTLIISLPITKLEGIRIDFGLIPNRFDVRSIEIHDSKSQVVWEGQEIINGFIPNSNISIIGSDKFFTFYTGPVENKFDPNMIINKNGINKMALQLYHLDKIISSSLKIVISSQSNRLCYFWYVPESLEKEKYYLIPNRVAYFVNGPCNMDTINVNIYSEGYMASFCLDFIDRDSTYVYLHKLMFNDPVRNKYWTSSAISKEFSPNENINKTLTKTGLRLDLEKSVGYVGPRVYYEFDMLKLSYLKNSFKVNIRGVELYINTYLLVILVSAVVLIIINKQALPNINLKS